MKTDIKTIPASDLDAVVAVQQQSYPKELWEDAAIFREKQRVFPEGALGWYQDGVLQAYLFVHPWRKNETAPLFTENMSLPENPDCLYIHDLAIAPAARGKVRRALWSQPLSRWRKKTGWSIFHWSPCRIPKASGANSASPLISL